MTITRDLEIPKHPTQMLKYKHAYLMSQVINYYKYVKSAHIIVTTFLLHYCERWLCQSKYTFTFKITASINVLETVLFLSTVTLYTFIVNQNLSECLCKNNYEFYRSSEKNYMAKKCHFLGMMLLSNF